MITYIRTRDGLQVDEREAIDERGCIRDGHIMRSKVMLRDGVPVTDEQKHQQREDRIRQLSDAWRDPAAQFRSDTPSVAAHDAELAKLNDAYERRDRRLQNAWRY